MIDQQGGADAPAFAKKSGLLKQISNPLRVLVNGKLLFYRHQVFSRKTLRTSLIRPPFFYAL